MRKQKSRLLAATKLSDYHIKRIVWCFVAGKSASEAARSMSVSYRTIRTIYGLIRLRLAEIMYYQPANKMVERFEASDEMKPYWSTEEFLDYLHLRLAKRKGAKNGGVNSMVLHEAELADRFLSEERPNFANRKYAEIIKLIRLSGPLNRQPSLQDLLRTLEYVADRFDDRERLGIPKIERWIEEDRLRANGETGADLKD